MTRDNTQFLINHLFELPTENTDVGPVVCVYPLFLLSRPLFQRVWAEFPERSPFRRRRRRSGRSLLVKTESRSTRENEWCTTKMQRNGDLAGVTRWFPLFLVTCRELEAIPWQTGSRKTSSCVHLRHVCYKQSTEDISLCSPSAASPIASNPGTGHPPPSHRSTCS